MKNSSCITTMAVAAMVCLTVASCGSRVKSASQTGDADSLLDAAYRAHDYNVLFELADSMAAAGRISSAEADYWQGYACYNRRQSRIAEFHWKRVVESDIKTPKDFDFYTRSASRLANLYLLRSDYEATMKVAMPALKVMEETRGDTIGDYANLLTAVGSCQLKLSRPHEAAASYDRAFRSYEQLLRRDQTGYYYKSAIVGIINTTSNYLTSGLFEDASRWIDRFEDVLTRFEQRPEATQAYIDKQRTRLYLYRATALEGLGRSKEAARVYRKALETDYSKTADGRIEANDYLMAAKRWSEAAENYRCLDSQVHKYNLEWTFDNIGLYLLPKYRANVGAHRKDSTIAIGLQLCGVIDSAIIKLKKDDAAELATIYDSRQKEAQIARQQADLTKQRFVGTAAALGLIIIGMSVYTLSRRKAQHRLADAHNKLKAAYDQLEETTTAKERIESELRIARDIQRSIVPNVFPEREGLDLYAYMMPAREVGGDLYDYLVEDNLLYFCLGDVSGKGVPAALFMAQATRLFRAMAKQRMMPANIANRLNEELTEGNENGMFVTMFIGVIDLSTDKMDFCNAGHNPPVLDGAFIEMESNAPIGLWEGLEFVGEQIDNVKGKQLFVYTDGLNEAENRQQVQFGEDRLLDILQHTRLSHAKEIIELLTSEVDSHRDGAEPNDDLTMMCLRVE